MGLDGKGVRLVANTPDPESARALISEHCTVPSDGYEVNRPVGVCWTELHAIVGRATNIGLQNQMTVSAFSEEKKTKIRKE
jgi:hypothetical protein